MSTRNNFTLVLLGLFVSVLPLSGAEARNLSFSPKTPLTAGFEEGGCNEPAPTNLHITRLYPTEIWVAWDAPANPPAGYNIKAWETGTGNLVFNQTHFGISNAFQVTGLQPNTEYRIRVTPACPDGTLSPLFAEGTGTTLIIDLVANGFNAPPPPTNCGIDANGEFCYAEPTQGNIVRFKVRHKNNTELGRLFGVYQVLGCNATTIMVRPEDDGSGYQFYCSSDMGGDVPNCSGEVVLVYLGNTFIAKFTVGDAPADLQFIQWVGDNPQQYEIVRYDSPTGVEQKGDFSGCGFGDPDSRPGKPVKGRDGSNWRDIRYATDMLVSPNPFHDWLDIKVPFAEENIETVICVLDLQGRCLLQAKYPGNQTSITLPTETLPKGMYFVRAQSGGVSQTQKVVKAE